MFNFFMSVYTFEDSTLILLFGQLYCSIIRFLVFQEVAKIQL